MNWVFWLGGVDADNPPRLVNVALGKVIAFVPRSPLPTDVLRASLVAAGILAQLTGDDPGMLSVRSHPAGNYRWNKMQGERH